MESPPYRFSSISKLLNEPSKDSPTMTTLTLRPSFTHFPDMMWKDRMMDIPSRPRSQPQQQERIELPSIRQAVPEIQLRGTRAELEHRTEQISYSPAEIPRSSGTPLPSIRPQSSHKRRRFSNEEELDFDLREQFASRFYQSSSRPQRSQSAALSPKITRRRGSVVSTAESWSGGSTRTSPYSSAQRLPAMRSPPQLESATISQSEWRPSLPILPSLPALTIDRKSPHHQPWSGEYALDPVRLGAQGLRQQSSSPFDSPPPSSRQSLFSYGYQQPRVQPSSAPSTSNTLSNTPFSSNTYQSNCPTGNFPYGIDLNDVGNDNKQRKRRGNLPKETTDTLRAWFHDHLQHPYPTEDEKQELMRQTGLQLNQISNWFINARRRQLPAIINNARVESGATSARGANGGLKSGYAGKISSIVSGEQDGSCDEYPGRPSSRVTFKRENSL